MHDEFPVEGSRWPKEDSGDYRQRTDFTEEQLGDADLMHYEAEQAGMRARQASQKTRFAIERFFDWMFNTKRP